MTEPEVLALARKHGFTVEVDSDPVHGYVQVRGSYDITKQLLAFYNDAVIAGLEEAAGICRRYYKHVQEVKDVKPTTGRGHQDAMLAHMGGALECEKAIRTAAKSLERT